MYNLKKYFSLLLLVIIFIAQILTGIYLILKNQEILNSQPTFLISVNLNDPYDLFRGRYLNMNNVAIKLPQELVGSDLDEYNENYADKKVPVSFGVDSNGYAKITGIGKIPENKNYANLKLPLIYKKDKDAVVRIPFNKYFGNEKKVLEAQAFINKTKNVKGILSAKIYKGHIIITNLSINGKKLVDF